jgi:hydrogenase large subunit
MPETITIDPFVRLEGHLAIKVSIDDGRVDNAWTMGTHFRGFETILAGRDPRDAPVITSAICGVCHSDHALAAARAAEDAAGIRWSDLPENAVLVRNIVAAAQYLWDHLAHTFVLTGPDYDLYGLGLKNYATLLKEVVLPVQRWGHEIIAIFGGKTPHHWSTHPGGETAPVDVDKIAQAHARLKNIEQVYKNVKPVVESYLDAHAELFEFGVGYPNFLAYGDLPDPADPDNVERNFYKRGVIIDGEKRTLDHAKIYEHVTSSYYQEGTGGNPAEKAQPRPEYGKQAAYTWVTAPRYEGEPYQVGPLARLVVSGYYKPRNPMGSSTGDRLMARFVSAGLVVEKLYEYVSALTPGGAVAIPYSVPDSGKGVGIREAPRGALGHWVNIEGKKIAKYNIITPSNWNFSPRDDKGQLGPVERALLDVPVDDLKRPINVVRTTRSFDPCLACSVHVMHPVQGTTVHRIF